MKKKILLFIFLIPIFGNAQAHLGSTLEEIKAIFPNKTFEIHYTNAGTKYATADMNLGQFAYFFGEDGKTFRCSQMPYNIKALNAQVEIYNKNYVIISETSWKAYLEGGGIMKINLDYSEKYEISVFNYEF